MEMLLQDHHQLMQYLQTRSNLQDQETDSVVVAVPARCEIDLTQYLRVEQSQQLTYERPAELQNKEKLGDFNQIYLDTQRLLQSACDVAQSGVSRDLLPSKDAESVKQAQEQPESSSDEFLGNSAQVSDETLQGFQNQKLQEKLQQMTYESSNDKALLNECKSQLQQMADEIARQKVLNEELTRQNCALEQKVLGIRANAEVKIRQLASTIRQLETDKYGDRYRQKTSELQVEISTLKRDLLKQQDAANTTKELVQRPIAQIRTELNQARKSLAHQIQMSEERFKCELMQLQTVVQIISEKDSRQDAQEQANRTLLESLRGENRQLVEKCRLLSEQTQIIEARNVDYQRQNDQLRKQLAAVTDRHRQISTECVKSRENITRMKAEYDKVVAQFQRLLSQQGTRQRTGGAIQ